MEKASTRDSQAWILSTHAARQFLRGASDPRLGKNNGMYIYIHSRKVSVKRHGKQKKTFGLVKKYPDEKLAGRMENSIGK